MILSAYIGDFKMAGPEHNMTNVWSLIRGGFGMDDPTNHVKYLGCGHEKLNSALP